jgi:hypothetical protein
MARYIVTGDAIYVPREAGARVYRQSGRLICHDARPTALP